MHTAITHFRLRRSLFVTVYNSNIDNNVGAICENSLIRISQLKHLKDSLVYLRRVEGDLSEHSLHSSMRNIFPIFSIIYFLIDGSFRHSPAIVLLHFLATARPILLLLGVKT